MEEYYIGSLRKSSPIPVILSDQKEARECARWIFRGRTFQAEEKALAGLSCLEYSRRTVVVVE